mgnify:CR=1 FL=1|tara:strand:- start:1285 stop:1785 length:501 start_codon:yes stop_codon:yes gene_type:complete
MDASEKDTLLQFMGQVYGETKKNDQMVVGQSQQLQPRANQVKQQFEQLLRTPAQARADTLRQPVQVQPTQAARVVTPEQAAQELAQVTQEQPVASQPTNVLPVQYEPVGEVIPVDPNQLEFDLSEPSKVDRIIELLEVNNKLLVEIRDSGIQSKHNAKRVKNTKPQ